MFTWVFEFCYLLFCFLSRLLKQDQQVCALACRCVGLLDFAGACLFVFLAKLNGSLHAQGACENIVLRCAIFDLFWDWIDRCSAVPFLGA